MTKSKRLYTQKELEALLQQSSSNEEMTQEFYKEVQDEAHVQKQAESVLEEQKTLSEKESESKQKIGRIKSGQSDLEAERELEQALEKSTDSLEEQKEKQKVKEKRYQRNKDTIENVTDKQIKRLRAIQADFIAKADAQVGNEVHSVSLMSQYEQQRDTLLQAGNSLSNLISMVINDKLMNMGKDKTYEENHIGERNGVFGAYEGRKKTLVIHGAMVTLDEDVAHAIEKQRSPMLGSGGSKRLYSAAGGLTAREAKELQKEVQKLLSEIEEIIQNSGKQIQGMNLQTDKLLHQSLGKVVQTKQDILREQQIQDMSVREEQEILEQNRQERWRFEALEAQMEADRQRELSETWTVPRYRYGKQGLYDEYDKQAEQQRQLERQRQIPQISWEAVTEYEYLPNGRQVPVIRYEQQVDYVYAY